MVASVPGPASLNVPPVRHAHGEPGQVACARSGIRLKLNP